jgi:hypothetical protein
MPAAQAWLAGDALRAGNVRPHSYALATDGLGAPKA